MTRARPSDRTTSARLAIAAVFFVNGATFASWTPRLPEIRERLDVSDAALGLTLVGIGVGGLAASLVSGVLVDRRGSRVMTVFTSAGLSILLPVIGFAPTALLTFATLIAMGALDGLTDVAMNAQAIELQHRLESSIITRFHALWSAGALVGGVVASRAAAAGLSLSTQLVITSAVLVASTVVAARWLLPDSTLRPHRATERKARSSRQVFVALFLVGTAVALAEAPMNDWAALLMADRFELGAGTAALGFVAVAGGMLLGRLGGDHVTDRFGLEVTRRSGAALAAIGIVVAALVPAPAVAGGGLLVAGIGLSSLFPLLFRAASEITHGTHSGMAAFSSGARLGFLLAAPIVGAIATAGSVAIGVLIVAGGAAAVTAIIRLPTGAADELTPDPL